MSIIADIEGGQRMKRFLVSVAVVAALGLPSAGVTLADNPHSGGSTGQPSQSCQATSPANTPGNSASAPGSPFNPNGNAGTHYAGTQPQNSNNPKSVAQYDVACFQQTQH
jgi:hypothetical protein